MSSYLERQTNAFKGNLASVAGKIGGGSVAGQKRSRAPPSPSPSIASNASRNAETPTKKAKRTHDAAAAAAAASASASAGGPATIYSQPEVTGFGRNIHTQMTYVVEWLKGKEDARTLDAVLGHLSAHNYDDKYKRSLAELMRNHPRIQWVPDPRLTEQTWRSGTYLHRPEIPGVRSRTTLLSYLQRKLDAEGVEIKKLKDGWPDCERALAEMEKDHLVLVYRTKKDNHPKYVWIDDKTLHPEVEEDLKTAWRRVQVPGTDDIFRALKDAGQKPTAEDPRTKAAANKPKEKKKRQQRRPGKTTNTHMDGLLEKLGTWKKQ